MGIGEVIMLVLVLGAALLAIVSVGRSVRVVPQQRMYVVERLGRYQRTLTPGLNLLVPFVDAVRARVDIREQVVSFPPQPVITSDNLVVSIDTVLYFRVTDPVKATYEIANFLQAIEQLTVTTLRNVIGSMDLERSLTSREEVNRQLSAVLDENTGRWGVKVTRVEIKSVSTQCNTGSFTFIVVFNPSSPDIAILEGGSQIAGDKMHVVYQPDKTSANQTTMDITFTGNTAQGEFHSIGNCKQDGLFTATAG